MSEKSNALRLADELNAAIKQVDADDDVIHVARWFVEDAAAELRRLHEQNQRFYAQHASVVSDYEKAVVALKAQRDALKQTLHDELAGNLRMRDLGGARPDEPMLTFLERIIAERDALLEALKLAVRQNEHDMVMTGEECRQCRAAIKMVEEEGWVATAREAQKHFDAELKRYEGEKE